MQSGRRSGGSLNMNVHFHVAAADGAWRCPTDGTAPVFVATRAPSRDDLMAVVERVARRVAAKLESRGERRGDGVDPLGGCRGVATTRGTFGIVRGRRREDPFDGSDGDGNDDGAAARYGRRPPKAHVAELEGFNLHAGVVIAAKDRDGLERLLRYMARPAVVLDRVSELEDGRVAWKLKMPGSRGETHRIMEPIEFMARLAALVPPPRYPLVRYHGAFAPHSPWRAAIVPGPRRSMTSCAAGTARENAPSTGTPAGAVSTPPERPSAERDPPGSGPTNSADVLASPTPPEGAGKKGGANSAAGLPRLDWALLLKRVWGADVLACPKCPERMRFIAVIQQRAVIVRILDHLGLPSAPIAPAPARRWDDSS